MNTPPLDKAGTQWTPEEFVRALDLYLNGYGFTSLSSFLGRRATAVENVILSDIPRNYRRSVERWVAGVPRRSRSNRPWSFHERQYLHTLLSKGRSQSEICTILGRKWSAVKKELDRTKLPPRRGFDSLAAKEQ